MSKEFSLISTRQYIDQASKWLATIGRGESASVLLVPKTDRHIRLGQLLNDRNLMQKVLGKKSSYIFQNIDFDSHNVEASEELYFQISQQLNFAKIIPAPLSFDGWIQYLRKHNITLVLILPEAEKFLTSESKMVLSFLSYMLEEYSPTINIISFFETDITHPSLLPYLPSSTRLYEHVFPYPLYSPADTLAFIQIIKRQWNVAISRKEEEKIIAACGGHFWLAKEAVHELATTRSWSGNYDGMLFRLRSIYNLLLPSEKTVLKKIVGKKQDFSVDEQVSFNYLQKVNIVDKESQCRIGLFKDFIRNHMESTSGLVLANGHIAVNQVPVDTLFSRKEYRVIKFLLERKNSVVTRDEIGERLWASKREQYSDWAIDQLITRLRKRLADLSISPKILASVRGKGYVLKIS